MESEQYQKMVEDIRILLARGRYILDGDNKPFQGQAEIIANTLWIDGYRPEITESVVYRRLFTQQETAWVQLWALRKSLTERLDLLKEEHEEYAGLRYALEEVQSRLDTVERAREHWRNLEEVALKKEYSNE